MAYPKPQICSFILWLCAPHPVSTNCHFLQQSVENLLTDKMSIDLLSKLTAETFIKPNIFQHLVQREDKLKFVESHLVRNVSFLHWTKKRVWNWLKKEGPSIVVSISSKQFWTFEHSSFNLFYTPQHQSTLLVLIPYLIMFFLTFRKYFYILNNYELYHLKVSFKATAFFLIFK